MGPLARSRRRIHVKCEYSTAVISTLAAPLIVALNCSQFVNTTMLIPPGDVGMRMYCTNVDRSFTHFMQSATRQSHCCLSKLLH